MGTNCLIEGLRCGQNYTASVIGTNLKCNSTASEEVTFMTGRSEAWITCLCHREKYNAPLQQLKTLIIPLPSHYKHSLPSKNDNLAKSDLMCPHSPTIASAFPPAPCPPTNIEAFRDCDANHALIVWQNHQTKGLYTATIEDQSGTQLTCTSNTVNNCKITSLPCGKTYSVTVTYNDGNCPSTSTPINMDSGSKLRGVNCFSLEER